MTQESHQPGSNKHGGSFQLQIWEVFMVEQLFELALEKKWRCVNIWFPRAAKDAGPTLGGATERNLSECFHGGHSHSHTSQRACGQTSEVIWPLSTPITGSHASYVSPRVPASSLIKLAEELVHKSFSTYPLCLWPRKRLVNTASYPKTRGQA